MRLYGCHIFIFLGWQDHMTLKTSLTHNVTSICLVNDSVWFGDNLGFVHAYSSDKYHKLFTYKMEPDELEDASPVRSIHFLEEIQRACVAMHNGRMFLCCAKVTTSLPTLFKLVVVILDI